MVAHTYNPSNWEAKIGESQFEAIPGLSQKQMVWWHTPVVSVTQAEVGGLWSDADPGKSI
jgi:hypothetical protein